MDHRKSQTIIPERRDTPGAEPHDGLVPIFLWCSELQAEIGPRGRPSDWNLQSRSRNLGRGGVLYEVGEMWSMEDLHSLLVEV